LAHQDKQAVPKTA